MLVPSYIASVGFMRASVRLRANIGSLRFPCARKKQYEAKCRQRGYNNLGPMRVLRYCNALASVGASARRVVLCLHVGLTARRSPSRRRASKTRPALHGDYEWARSVRA